MQNLEKFIPKNCIKSYMKLELVWRGVIGWIWERELV